MTLDGCRRWREQLGAYLFDRIAPAERVALEAHLDGCADCRAELAELRPVAASLSAADPAHLGAPPAPPAELADRVLWQVRSARRAAFRRRWALRATAGVAAAVIAISIALALKPAPRVEKEVFAFKTLPVGVVADATLYHRTAGVEVWIKVKGLAPGRTYAVWVRRRSGDKESLGTFKAVTGTAHIVLPSTVQRIDAIAVGVSDLAGHELMLAPVTPPKTA
jgi:anti-sigma factor RsiW